MSKELTLIVVSRNNFTPTRLPCEKANRDILRMVKQWIKGKPITKIAELSATRQVST